ncbi:MAG TPA: NAD(P)/FAD-dependent oxidoreductase [Solirubrobacteraceae bacterium]|jgi:cation diffusion facilitator CzcD-associated flavoprotein CzcO|nr:NAD(P)/FAD-dependent oxidoreductase [Solirubrobacteraceae bacterium]
MIDHLDVLIIGAGISGIGAACHLKNRQPQRSFAILEGREAIGGTWDLFRYPGIRSDSDLQTFGYAFKPWTNERAIADAGSILAYLRETVAENDIEPHIRFGHRVIRAEWSSEDACWQVDAVITATGEEVHLTASWLFSAAGYYRYDEGYTPDFPAAERFSGTIVHPQHWPEELDYTGKRVVVIGSGLNMQAFGGAELIVDGVAVDTAETVAYKSFMLSDVPNFSFVFGYTNSSWTLKVDLVCEHLCRLFDELEAGGYDHCVPVDEDPANETSPFIGLSSGYISRGIDRFPRQGSLPAWQVTMNYEADVATLGEGPVADPGLRFGRTRPTATRPAGALTLLS